MESQFWLVWNPDERTPRVRHGSEGAAKTEADRLSISHPGHRFYVLEAVGYVTKRETEWVSFTGGPF